LFNSIEILKHIEEKNERKFTFELRNGNPKKKYLSIIMSSNLPNEEKKRLRITIDLS
jgi:hypothetical protein